MEDEWNQKILSHAKGMRKCYKIKTITQIKGHTRKLQVAGSNPASGSRKTQTFVWVLFLILNSFKKITIIKY